MKSAFYFTKGCQSYHSSWALPEPYHIFDQGYLFISFPSDLGQTYHLLTLNPISSEGDFFFDNHYFLEQVNDPRSG